MNNFERALRLLLELHDLNRTGFGESSRADDVRDQMDKHWGWHGGDHSDDLTSAERVLLTQVSALLTNTTGSAA